ncbi:MAG: PIG-L family deacetylase [Phototrophicaceae bacterium]
MQNLPPINEQRILAVYAHPDDECYCSGGTLAKYNASNAETMVISATKGQAGQINDTRVATRTTLGQLREQELYKSCEQLNVSHVACWNYMDGALKDADWRQLVGDVVYAIRQFRPHIVLTFGLDGAYGHPDHIAIGEATTQAFNLAGDTDAYPEQDVAPYQPARLYYAYFPERQVLLLDHLAKWLVTMKERFHGNLDFVHGLSLFAEESTMLNYANDFVDTRWYPPGFSIVEQGETAVDLYVLLSGSVDVKQEDSDGNLTHIATLKMGDFFGEMGLIGKEHTRNAHVVAREAVTCLKFSPGEPTKFAGRGEGAAFGGAYRADDKYENVGIATHMIDIEEFIINKIRAISQHRTQYPIHEDMFPMDMLRDLFGREYFVQMFPKRDLKNIL